MEFRVLGPVEIVLGGRPVATGGPKPKTLFALLAVNAGQVVAFDEIVDAIWGEEPPDQARAAVHTYVSALRRSLSPVGASDLITRTGGGYLLGTEPAHVDLHVFDSDVAAGRAAFAAGELDRASTAFEAALGLWRGTALGGAQGWWAENERARLEERCLAAVEDRADVGLAAGTGADLVAELGAAVDEHPFRERLRGQLIMVLHQVGRQADALGRYQEGCRVLRDELGLEPGPALRTAYDSVIRHEHDPPASGSAAGQPRYRPRQLPSDIADFTGRSAETQQLSATLSGSGSTGRLCAIFGKPGAGKSSLALRVAHLVRDDFPDGQLYATLRGVQAVPADPGEVLATFLRAMGVDVPAIPAELDERAQLYRSIVADRRVLVVLDDAADERQIRPLLPGSHSCAVLVTSRERLGALDGADHIGLRLLDEPEAIHLLERVVGGGRVGAERDQAREIVRLCGRLPLALRIAGARLAARPHWRIVRLVERLRVQRDILRELAVGDLEVRGSVALSYNGLSERERIALRRLGLLDLSSFGGWLLAPLMECSVRESEELVERLADAQLLDVANTDGTSAPRFQIHDLIRAFARERGEAEESADEIRAASTRVAECLLVLVEAAGGRTSQAAGPNPYLDGKILGELLADADGWFDGEQAGLVRVVERISELELTGIATRLASALCDSRFSGRNMFGQWWRTHSAALAAARGAGDRTGEARLLAGLGWLRYEQDRFDEAVSYHEQAIAAYTAIHDRHSQAVTRLALSTVLREQGRLVRARAVLDLAAADLTDPRDTARAAHELGRVLTEQGDLDGALVACQRTLTTYRALGDRTGEAVVLRSMGIVHRAAGRLSAAARPSAQAVGLLEHADDRLPLAYARQSLAKVRIRQGEGEAVREDLLACLATCCDMQDGFGQALMLRTLGELELAEGNPREARHFLRHSLQWWAALSLPVWRARTLRDLSRTLVALDEPIDADAAWDEALVVFHRHGTREAAEPRHEQPILAGSVLVVGDQAPRRSTP